MTDLPAPICAAGYTYDQIEEITGDLFDEFCDWIYGQTQALCDGRRYNHETEQYEPSGCDQPHGVVTYVWDLKRFLDRRPVVD